MEASAKANAIDINAAVSRNEIALRDKNGHPIAIVFRNFDGARGARLLASAALNPAHFLRDDGDPTPGTTTAMAGPNRTSSLTMGSGQSNNSVENLGARMWTTWLGTF